MKQEVLVVEDEALIRMLAVEAFEDAGFTVHEAGSVLGAIAVLSTHQGIGAIFTDINLGSGPSGIDLAAMVAVQYPRIGILVTSGRCQFNRAEFPLHAEFVAKPYRLDAIVDAVRQAMSAPPLGQDGVVAMSARQGR